MSIRTALVAAALVAVLAGCSAPAPAPLEPSPTASPAPEYHPGVAPDDGGVYPLLPATHPHVQLTCPLVGAVHYDPGLIAPSRVDGVYICTAEPWTPAPDGTPQLVEYVDRVAAEDVATLLGVYTIPDAEPTDDNCIMSLQDPLIIWLHYGDQHITAVYAPRDGCGFPNQAAVTVYQGLHLHRLLVAREKEKE